MNYLLSKLSQWLERQISKLSQWLERQTADVVLSEEMVERLRKDARETWEKGNPIINGSLAQLWQSQDVPADQEHPEQKR